MYTDLLHVHIAYLKCIFSCNSFLLILETRLEDIQVLVQPFLDIALKLQQVNADMVTSVYLHSTLH